MTTLQEAARDALEALERIGKDFVCRSAHHAKKDQHSAFAECPVVVRHTDAIESLRTALAQQVAQKPVAVSDAMVEAYLTAQRKTVEEADRFGRPNVGGLHTNTVREACRNGISAALAAAPAPVAQQGEQQVCAGCGIPVGDVHMSTCKSGKWPSRVSNGDAPAPMTAKRAAYFMERFKKDEKLLGPNEQAAVAFVLEMLAQQGEPVAYLVYANGSRRYSTLTFDVNKVPEIYIGGEAIPLYTAAPAPQAQERSTCNHCDGTGWVVRDPDIGTDQECFVCDGSGYVKEEPAPQTQPDWLLKTTQDLANSIRRRCFPEVPQFQVLDDLAGVISQIDNMTCGMERKSAPQAQPVTQPLTGKEIAACIPDNTDMSWVKNPEKFTKEFVRAIEAAHGIREVK